MPNTKANKQGSRISTSPLMVPIDKDIHKKIRIFCIENDITLKDFLKEAILEKACKMDIL